MGSYLPRRPSTIAKGVTGILLSPIMVVLKAQMRWMSVLFHWLEVRSKFTNAGYPKNYVAIVVKPRLDDTR
jgi:hypothetical protein